MKPLPKDQWKYPEHVMYSTFRRINIKHKKTGGKDGIQHWGFSRRFNYDVEVPRAGDKVKMAKKPGKKQKPKNGKPGPGRYEITSTWNLSKDNKNQDIQKRRTKSAYRSIYYSKY